MKNFAGIFTMLSICGMGCSWSQMTAPSTLPASPDEFPTCTTSTTPAAVDSGAAVGFGLLVGPGLLYALAVAADFEEDWGAAAYGIALPAGVAVALIASARYGFRTARQSEEARRMALQPREERQVLWESQVERWRAKCARLRVG